MGETGASLCSGFLRSAEAFSDRPALTVEGETISYEDLRRSAQSLAATLQRHDPGGESPLTAVFAYRNRTAFAGVLGALLRGHAVGWPPSPATRRVSVPTLSPPFAHPPLALSLLRVEDPVR